MVGSVNKYKMSLEPAKHINDSVVKLLHQTVEARESNIENRTRRSKIKIDGVIVNQNNTITDFLQGKNNQSNDNHNFLHGKNNQSNHNYITGFCMCNYGLIAFLATSQIKLILPSM